MRTVFVAALLGAPVVALTPLAACFSDDSGAKGGDGGPDATADVGADVADEPCVVFQTDANLTMPVTYANDVRPLFQHSCALGGAACHGDPTVATVIQPPRPFLGYVDGGPDSAVVLEGLVGKKSAEDPAMVLVAAADGGGDPGKSFLMHKMDGDQCVFAAACAAGDSGYPMCGVSMPMASGLLDEPTRDLVRRWIAQGAKNN
jgi:hypothetical protein